MMQHVLVMVEFVNGMQSIMEQTNAIVSSVHAFGFDTACMKVKNFLL